MDELVKNLRKMKNSGNCVIASTENFHAMQIIEQAANAIEELSDTVKRQSEILLQYGGETGIRQAFESADGWAKMAAEYKAAYITEHDTRVAELPRWIPVTERLPKEGEFVLVYGDLYPNKHDGGVIAVSKRMDWNYWQGFGRERNITHWMPLPQAPKEET